MSRGPSIRRGSRRAPSANKTRPHHRAVGLHRVHLVAPKASLGSLQMRKSPRGALSHSPSALQWSRRSSSHASHDHESGRAKGTPGPGG